MAEPLRLRHRRRLKHKEAAPFVERLESEFGMTGLDSEAPIDVAEAERVPVYLFGNEVIALEAEGKTVPALRGLLKWPAKKRWVTVDMGAIKFVTNGADVMGPGITDADPEIQVGDAVWVRDVTHGRPLAVGLAREPGPVLKTKPKGKVVTNVHTVGDKLWDIGHEESKPKEP